MINYIELFGIHEDTQFAVDSWGRDLDYTEYKQYVIRMSIHGGVDAKTLRASEYRAICNLCEGQIMAKHAGSTIKDV